MLANHAIPSGTAELATLDSVFHARQIKSSVLEVYDTGVVLDSAWKGITVYCMSSDPTAVTIPQEDQEPGWSVTIAQGGTGAVTFAAGTSVLRSFGGSVTLAGQYASATLTRVAANTYLLAGKLL